MTLNHASILNLARSHSELVQNNKLSKLLLMIFHIVAYYDHNYKPSHMLNEMNTLESDHDYWLKD